MHDYLGHLSQDTSLCMTTLGHLGQNTSLCMTALGHLSQDTSLCMTTWDTWARIPHCA